MTDREANVIVTNLSLDEILIAMQPTEKDRLEAIEFVNKLNTPNENTENPKS